MLLLGLYSRFKAAWVVTLFKIQIALIYFKASFHRINDPGWLNGDMLIFAAHSVYAKWPQVNWIEYEYLLKILSYLGWLLELFAPIGLFLRKFQTATITAILLIIFHIMLELLTNVGLWSYIMSTLLLVF
ncbi:MAG: HTTM domain-containing protein, partial [Bdellovibrionales bacterium]|nr:HTTM domain-containing protein [Bdellovibrionales bacterium]